MAEMITDIMSQLDSDKDGTLQLAEVCAGLDTDNATEGKQEFEAMLREVDFNFNSQIDASEMPAFLQKLEEMEAEEDESELFRGESEEVGEGHEEEEDVSALEEEAADTESDGEEADGEEIDDSAEGEEEEVDEDVSFLEEGGMVDEDEELDGEVAELEGEDEHDDEGSLLEEGQNAQEAESREDDDGSEGAEGAESAEAVGAAEVADDADPTEAADGTGGGSEEAAGEETAAEGEGPETSLVQLHESEQPNDAEHQNLEEVTAQSEETGQVQAEASSIHHHEPEQTDQNFQEIAVHQDETTQVQFEATEEKSQSDETTKAQPSVFEQLSAKIRGSNGDVSSVAPLVATAGGVGLMLAAYSFAGGGA